MKYIQVNNNKYVVEFDSELERSRFESFVTTDNSLRAADVMKMLNITRPTLCHYVKKGLIKIDKSYTGKQYRYERESVMALMEEKK